MSIVKGSYIEPSQNIDEVQQPGAFQYQTLEGHPVDPAHHQAAQLELCYRCPRTGKICGEVLIYRAGTPKPTYRPSWAWNGDTTTPTLTPSINCRGGCGWHGGLKNGVFTEPYNP